MASPTVENYLKQIYLLQQGEDATLVAMGRLATLMGVVPGTATAMVKALADSGLVAYEPREGVRLTPAGERLALHVLRRHRLVELFLVKVLKLDWSEVHEEAEELEHAISDKVIEKIDALLGHPSVDPHGDPIPPSEGTHRERTAASLAGCAVGARVKVARVRDQDRAFLQFAEKNGLTPGTTLTIIATDEAAESITVRPEGRDSFTIGKGAADKILVNAG